MGRLEVKSTDYALARNITYEGDVAAQTLSWYGGLQELKGMIDTHLKSAKSDDQAFIAAKKAGDDKQLKPDQNGYLTGAWRYAVVVTAPAGVRGREGRQGLRPAVRREPRRDRAAGVRRQGGGVRQVRGGRHADRRAYRGDPGKETFTPGELQTQGTDQIPSKKVLPLIDNGVARAVLQGNEATAWRCSTPSGCAISDRAKKPIQDANKLEPLLQTQANKGSPFFMKAPAVAPAAGASRSPSSCR